MTGGYFIWFFLQPVKIIAIHKDGDYSAVLVNHFPFTDRGKITWWHNNKEMLKTRYGVPSASSDGSFTVTFWIFGEGYMEEGKHEQLCFPDMKQKKRCIEKNKSFSVSKGLNGGINLMVYDGVYYKDNNDDWVKRQFSEQ